MHDGIIGSNPVARTGRLTRSKEDRWAHIQPLMSTDVIALLRTAGDPDSVHLFPLIMCAVQTGMWQGELIGLKWGDIDLKAGFIERRRAVTHGVETTTKSHKIRRVDMTPSLVEALQRLHETRSREASLRALRCRNWSLSRRHGHDGMSLTYGGSSLACWVSRDSTCPVPLSAAYLCFVDGSSQSPAEVRPRATRS